MKSLALLVLTSQACAFTSPAPLPFPRRHRADITSIEADVIQSIRNSQSLDNIHQILEYAAVAAPLVKIKEASEVRAPEIQVGPNVAAAALLKTAHFTSFEQNGKHNENSSSKTLTLLLENVGTAVMLALRNNATASPMTLYALSDVLISLGKLSRGYSPKLKPLASRVCDLVDAQRATFIRQVGPKRLVACLQTMTSLRLMDKTDFILETCDRLRCGDALGTLSARDLSHVLKVCANLGEESLTPMVATKTFMKRLRKQSVRSRATSSDLCRALVAVEKMYRNSTEIGSEAKIMGYTLTRELVGRAKQNDLAQLTMRQATLVLSASVGLGRNQSDPILTEFCESTCQSVGTCLEVAQILSCMQRIQLVQQPDSVQGLGETFEHLAFNGGEDLAPRAVSEILRSAALLHGRNETVMEPFLNGARALFLLEPENAFLSRCNSMQLSSFVWFMSMAQWYDNEILMALANRILEPDVSESCTPKVASRILGSFTSLVQKIDYENQEQRQSAEYVLSELFHVLGPHLLSAQLEPVDTSSALFAYAKASYIHDMGIFDHLAEQLALQLEECTVRQAAQSLWACGKMMMFENEPPETQSGAPAAAPPYLTFARKYATLLSSRASELTSKDVAQSIWAFGRLGITDLRIIYALACRAKQVSSSCTSQELANILWGLARVGYNDEETVSVLTSQIIRPSLKPTTQEAANALYALGRMGISDEVVFSKLTDAMMGQLQDVSAQAIANALWAYRAVHISPPQELIDSWATQKLGLIGLVGPPTYSKDSREK